MRARYGVVWKEENRLLASGMLEFRSGSIRFDGLCDRVLYSKEIAYEEIAALAEEKQDIRVDGRRAVAIELRSGATIVVASSSPVDVVRTILEHVRNVVAMNA